MQVKILNGIYTTQAGDIRVSYPRNLTPVPAQSGISTGYLRPADGIIEMGTGPGAGRGGIEWNGRCYRVMGTKLVRVENNGTITELGDVGAGGEVTLDYSFDYLGVCSGGRWYFYDGTTFQQNVDPDLGTVIDFIWIDGFFMFTDGEFVGVTELTSPFSVNPLKYGSSEVDPDPVKAVLKLRNEAQVLNRYTVESFDNIGGSGFPFQRIDGAQLTRGTVGTHTCCIFLENIAFVGGGRNEAIAVWLGSNGSTIKISTREIDILLNSYTEGVLESSLVEARVGSGHQLLYIHLPDRTLVYDGAASQVLQEPVWYVLDSSILGFSRYRAKNLVRCYDRWLVEDPLSNRVGYFSDTISSHWGSTIGWDFGTPIVYNDSYGAIFHQLELVCLNGRAQFGSESTVWTSYSTDGMTYSQEKPVRLGKTGDRSKRVVWFRQGMMRNWRIQRFRGTSDGHLTIARLEAQLEPLGA